MDRQFETDGQIVSDISCLANENTIVFFGHTENKINRMCVADGIITKLCE